MWGIPIHLRKAIVRINGTERVESVTMCDITPRGGYIQGSEQTVEVDFVCIAGGLYPLAELAAIIGCPFVFIEELGGHIPIHSECMETPIDGVFVAGNITGIESAKIARAQGTLAGLSIAKRKRKNAAQINDKVLEAMEYVKTVRSEATLQFHPDIDNGRVKMESAFQPFR